LDADEENVASQLKGNTLRVYWHLLQSSHDTVGARETQRALGFSSPALAVYHLDKLVNLGLVEKKRGEYYLLRKIDVGILRQFIRFGTLVLPRYILYAGLFTTLLIFYIAQVRIFNFYSVFALVFGVLGTAIMWYETFRIWHQRP